MTEIKDTERELQLFRLPSVCAAGLVVFVWRSACCMATRMIYGCRPYVGSEYAEPRKPKPTVFQ